MRKSLLVLAALLPLAAIVGLASLPSTAGAASITPEAPATTETVAANCATVPDTLPASAFDVIPTTPITGHPSIQRGCGGEDDDAFGDDERDGGEGEDD